MANNTFVGFPHGQGDTGIDAADVVKELQPLTSWNRDGGYTVTRRWRGPIDALKNFSDGGASNADYAGTYFTGTSGILLGGAGRDGAIKTDLQRDEGGQTGIFSATWVTSSLASATWTGAPTNPATRGGTSGDQYQESSLWMLDGNDLEKNIYESDIFKQCETTLDAAATDLGQGFTMRVKQAITNYQNGKDKNGSALSDPYTTKWDFTDYFGATSDSPLSFLVAGSSITGGTNLYTDLQSIAKDILKGQEGFAVSQFVLRNTKTTQYNSALIPHYANVNRIWTTANITTLMAGETRPIDPPTSTVANTLPLLGVLGLSFHHQNGCTAVPMFSNLGNGKWQITKEWFEGDDRFLKHI
jgi:hypothetical protein